MSSPSVCSAECSAQVLRYTPFDTGRYEISPGLSHFRVAAGDPQRRLLQLDREFPLYYANKQHCRSEQLQHHVLEADLKPETRRIVNRTLIEQLCGSYPDYFWLEAPGHLHCRLSGELLCFTADFELQEHPVYLNLWDALAAQVQEDLAIWQLEGERDWLAALHVCAPNGWAPAEKIGQSFDSVHTPVPGMERQRATYLPLLKGLIQKPAFCRFIWDLRTCAALNHHPETANLPPFKPEQPELWVRLERQVLYGLPACDAVLFTIRTYRYPVQELSAISLAGLDQALAGMSPELADYKRLDREALRAWLQRLLREAMPDACP
ncbi:MAG: heme-dependent oxidative N-demethylase subunit alpha family protein [Candidatus Sericytochromatia bacterium]